jgi:2-oxoglutarate dehydrogenase complex dehydrogenase (E1) component-like enzyme
MKEDILRRRLLKEKNYFHKLFKSDLKDRVNIIGSISNNQQTSLIHYLHKLTNGLVRMKREDFEELASKKKINYLRKRVESKKALKNALSDKTKSNQFLRKLSSVIPILLRPMFIK